MKKKENVIHDTPLTPKQLRFCEEYIIDLNGLQAAIRAEYSEATAQQQASRLLSNVKVQAKIQELMDKRSARTEITADRVLQELASVAFARIDDFLKVESVTETEYVPVNKETDDDEEEGGMEMKPVERTYKLVNIYETDKVDKSKLPAIASVKQTKEGIELKMHDKIKSLELLGRHLNLWKDKPEDGLTLNVVIKKTGK